MEPCFQSRKEKRNAVVRASEQVGFGDGVRCARTRRRQRASQARRPYPGDAIAGGLRKIDGALAVGYEPQLASSQPADGR
jgi:hypothetical protein